MNNKYDSLDCGPSFEEDFMGFEIFIEPNPDRWRGGFVWSVCKDGEEIDTDLVFDVNDAINAARGLILSYVDNGVCK